MTTPHTCTSHGGKFLLGILNDGSNMLPEEVAASEQKTPCYYDAPRFAVAAGRAIMDRHPAVDGFVVSRIFNVGQYRTVAVVLR